MLLTTLPASAVTRYVDVNSANPTPPYTNWATAANVIQNAIDASEPGDEVLVNNGAYVTGGKALYGTMTNRVAVDKPLILRSVNGPEFTIIRGYQVPGTTNGDGAIRCVYLTNGAFLSGFTLTNGATRDSGDAVQEQSGGGLLCESTNASASNCLVNGNSASSAGGGSYSGVLNDCSLTGNSASYGGGSCLAALNDCNLTGNSASSGGGVAQSTLNNCTIKGNSAADSGGGGHLSTLNGCFVSGNTAAAGGGSYLGALNRCTLEGNSALYGGGAYSSTLHNCFLKANTATNEGGGTRFGTLYNCNATENSANMGGASYQSTLFSCTVAGNSSSSFGGGCYDGTLRNCIVYFNINTTSRSADNYFGGNLIYSCTTPLPPGGIGNINDNPLLASATHLSAASPCRGKGSTVSTSGTDIDGEPWSSPTSIGCDEYWTGGITGALSVAISAAYTNIGLGFPVDFTAAISGHAAGHVWDFGDGTVISNQPWTTHAWTIPGDYPVVLTVFNETLPGGMSATLFVHVETPIHLVSADGLNATPPYSSWDTAATNIQDAIDAATVPGALVLVTNGLYDIGSKAIFGTMSNRVAVDKPVRVQSVNGPNLTIIKGHQVPGTTNGDGAIRGVYLTHGAFLSGFTITNGATRNSGDGIHERSGGGLWCASRNAWASNCIVAGNAGGGSYQGTLIDSSFLGNRSAGGGGATRSTLINCVLKGNTAASGGGASFSTLYGCLLADNSAQNGGGAQGGTLDNCTVTGNAATASGGGTFNAILNNSIVYGNTAPAPDHNFYFGVFNYSCTIPMPLVGTGNITNSPRFIDQGGGDFRLQSNSTCINAGSNNHGTTTSDLDGNQRVVGGTVDMGAYEFQSPQSLISYAWLQQHGLPADGSADFIDSDNDQANTWQEWRASTDPTNRLSVLRMLTPQLTANGMVVTWQSVSGQRYLLEHTADLNGSFSLLRGNITGQMGTTSYTDTNAIGEKPIFYRVEVPE